MASKMAAIQEALKTRLETITSANGYTTSVSNVYSDEIPMGLDLDESEMPAIFLIGMGCPFRRETQWYFGDWKFELQLVHDVEPDSTMLQFIRDVAKAIFADSPTAQRKDGFRSLHPAVYDVELHEKISDLNMIEANRIYIMELIVRFQTEIHDL